MSIYVEILMRTDMDKLWEYTQNPNVHARWDLRFSTIDYLPRPDAAQPQQFLYATRIGFGMTIRGKGETVGSREDSSDCRTSALKFWSDDPRSLIREGSGYWQYVPTSEGIRFLTQYNYQTRFGWPGHWIDRLLFRPLLGWATAWSFDRLRLWLERNVDPTAALERSVLYGLARVTLACIWIYQGLFPKLLFHDTGEMVLLQHTRLFGGRETTVLNLIGLGEILFGCLLVWRWHSRFLLALNILILVLFGAGALWSQPSLFVAPFNPLTLTLAMASLSGIGLLSAHDLPSARSCRRRRPEKWS
ncbi:MAG TPA: DoxX-like family protein [Chthonomonadaceae bacterium]|nr:DoxX-like family protein [Chthonomonadaceae bacterium]